MAEELVMNVKSNIKSVTKDTQDWAKSLDNVNESLDIQNKVITDLERDLIKLKTKQDAIPKGAFYAGMDKLNEKIKQTSNELNLEKLALKDLTNQQKTASREVKRFNNAQKETNTEVKSNIGEFQIMGVSLNSVKKGFSQIIPTAKSMFSTIKVGIMSTGIGALVLAVVALMQSFKRSEAGQEKFQRIMAAIGAVTSQVLDAFSDLGEIIIDTFKDPLPAMKNFGNGLLKFLRDPTGETRDMFVKATLSYKDFNEETTKEIDALIKVTEMRQKAHHIDRKLKVERAKANREINDIRLKAEDRENQSATERIALLRKAQAIEEGITAKEIKSKKILIEAQVLFMKQGHNNIEQKDKLAQLQADAINLDTKRLRSQRLLQTQITTAINEEMAARKDMTKIFVEQIDEKIDAIHKLAKAEDINFEKKKTIELSLQELSKKRIEWAAMTENERLNLAKNTFRDLTKIAGEETETGRALAITATTIDTFQSAQASYRSLAGIPVVGPVLGGIAAAAAVAMGLKNIAAIRGANSSGGVGGGGGGGNISAPAAQPAPQMMSGAFEMTGVVEPEPLRAFVVTDEMTSSQNQLANIRRRATI